MNVEHETLCFVSHATKQNKTKIEWHAKNKKIERKILQDDDDDVFIAMYLK
jgi:hypothetical protein